VAAEAPGERHGPPRRRRSRRHGSGLWRFIGWRLLALVPLAVLITLVAFCLTNLVPGDPAAANLGQRAVEDPAAVQAFRERNGLDKPLPQQYLTYVGNLMQGDLGTSQQTGRAVASDLGEFVPATLELACFAIVISLTAGVGLGLLAAVKRDGAIDQVLRVVSLIGVSVPVFWLALVAFFVLFYKLGLLPGSGRLSPNIVAPPTYTGFLTIDSLLAGDLRAFGSAVAHLILPSLVLAASTVGLLVRFVRSAVLEVLDQDYVRAARSKGLRPRTILFGHVLRAASVSIVTVIGLVFGALLSGTVLVEAIFAWPGVGQYAYRSATFLDLPAVMGVSLFVAVVYIVINLLVDVLYGLLDPRIRVGS
jgi:peptide/nickel transport system permease protein